MNAAPNVTTRRVNHRPCDAPAEAGSIGAGFKPTTLPQLPFGIEAQVPCGVCVFLVPAQSIQASVIDQRSRHRHRIRSPVRAPLRPIASSDSLCLEAIVPRSPSSSSSLVLSNTRYASGRGRSLCHASCREVRFIAVRNIITEATELVCTREPSRQFAQVSMRHR